jgi:rubrerythrin
MTSFAATLKSIDTALDLAVHLEMNGKAFYEKAMAAASDEKLKSLLSFLISQEQAHMDRYKRLAGQVTGQEAYQEELFGEYSMYIDLLVEEVAGKLEYRPGLSTAEVLDMAIGFEKDTLLFFNEVKSLFTGQAAETVDGICREEKKHVALLLAYKKGDKAG